jgi:predicted helicase
MRRMQEIKDFATLVEFLREELSWPIENIEPEYLAFDYEPDELGVDAQYAVKIREIKQLRPLTADQPWGIFFVDFEPKRLPVQILRRILRNLVPKKRGASGSAQAVWKKQDLLFIAAQGEAGQRGISFAHFRDGVSGKAVLETFSWDERETHFHWLRTLNLEHLKWPENPEDTETWRSEWSGAFPSPHRYSITTSRDLALEMAKLAKETRDLISTIYVWDKDLKELHKAFREVLIHDLSDADFADMVAQTITYGLFSARVVGDAVLGLEHLESLIPKTNPFLRELFGKFTRLSEGPIQTLDVNELGVAELVNLLNQVNINAILADFGRQTGGGQEDPVIHFYESFLKEYDAQKRMQRGVFYTPKPVVSYIVQSIHELLQTEFGLEDGLADTATWGEMLVKHPELKLPPLTDELNEKRTISPDEPFVQILDPATGTATFLIEVIDTIYATMVAKWKAQGLSQTQQIEAWNEYIPNHLLPRIHAYELMMAPYAIAHMKVGLKLTETGYRFENDERARIYLTNALEPKAKQLPLIGFEALAHEAAAVNKVKWYKRFTVVIGNPPYSNFGQLNKNPFILGLLEDYKRDLNERKLNLDDDFIKFVRFAQYLLEKTGIGVFGMITNNVFIDGITHRKMRESLLHSFSVLRFFDLHGSTKKLEQAPDGSKDENVFDIQQGVGISIFVKPPLRRIAEVMRCDLWGARENKYSVLSGKGNVKTEWDVLCPSKPNFFFTVEHSASERQEYERGWSTKNIFPVNNDGIQTKRDNLTIQFTKAEVTTAVHDLKNLPDTDLRAKYNLPDDGRDWAVDWARNDVEKQGGNAQVAYRPFDIRHTFYTGRSKGFIAYPRTIISAHLITEQNLGLVVNRFIKLDDIAHFFVVRSLVDTHLLETANSCLNVCPLYLFGETNNQLSLEQDKRPNFSPEFLKALASELNLKPGSPYGLPANLIPEDIFHYIYAVFHSPNYRSRYAEFLKIDFPRLPLTSNLELFRNLAGLGGELVSLHLIESLRLDTYRTTYTGPTSPEVTRIGWSNDTVWLDAAATKKGQHATPGTIGFKGVPEAVWNFHIGGYQVCEKWLKDRKGRKLSAEDISHYQKIVVALSETIRIMAKIDEVIEAHGGWPGAFQTGTAQE